MPEPASTIPVVVPWLPAEIVRHLTATFRETERHDPDLLEPYSVRLADAATEAEQVEIMRAGLRETIRERFPLHEQSGDLC